MTIEANQLARTPHVSYSQDCSRRYTAIVTSADAAAEQLEVLFGYHSWANAELISFCAALPPAQQQFSLPGTPGTVARTLTHLVSSEQLYLQAVTGEEPSNWIESLLLPVAELVDRDAENAATWRKFLTTRYDPRAVVTDPRNPLRTFVVWERVAQLLVHGIEHRTHTCSILGANGLEPPDVGLGPFGDMRRALQEP